MSSRAAALPLAVGLAGAPGVASAELGFGGHLAATLGHGTGPKAQGLLLELGLRVSGLVGSAGSDLQNLGTIGLGLTLQP